MKLTPEYKKNIIPILIGTRADTMIQIANSGENCGFYYTVSKETNLFYSIFNFPIDSDLESILNNYWCHTYECNYVTWFSCGDERNFYPDMQRTSEVSIFLTSYFNFKYPWYNLLFTPGHFCPDDWEKNGWGKLIKNQRGLIRYLNEFNIE